MAFLQEGGHVGIGSENATSRNVTLVTLKTFAAQQQLQNVVQPGDVNAAPISELPFNEGDEINQRFDNYYPECASNRKDFGRIAMHRKSVREFKYKNINGEHFQETCVYVVPRTRFAGKSFGRSEIGGK